MYRAIGLLALGLTFGAPTVSAVAADLPTKAPVSTVAANWAPWLDVFAGAAVDQPGWYADVGFVAAVNGNLYKDGWLVRARGGGGHYEYHRDATLKQGVDYETGEFMLGYQHYVGATRISLYAGANVEHHDNPDPFAVVAGTKWGFKAQGEIFAPFAPNWYALLLATYSTAFNSYFALAKVGYKINDLIAIGPEVAALGNDRFNAIRTGPFISFDLSRQTLLIFSGGYSWDERKNAFNDHSGAYGTVHIRHLF